MSAATNSYGGSYSYQNQKTLLQTVPINYCQEVTVLANSAWSHPYASGLIVPKMEHNYEANTTPSQTPLTPRFLFGNAANFQKIDDMNVYERPLLMDAWAQTTIEDFGLISDENRDRIDYLQKENALLRERVQTLESELRVHADLLSQISQVSNQAAALKQIKTHENMEHHISPTPPATPVMNQHVVQQTYQNTYTATATLHHTPQIMNSMRVNAGAHAHGTTTDSVKYTIVSQIRDEKHENQSLEPIEVHLAEDDGTLNLNSSADSGRLEICLGNEQEHHSSNITTPHQEISNFKAEIINEDNNSQLPPLPAQSGILVKRRKISAESQTLVRFHHEQSNRLKPKQQTSAEQQHSTTPNINTLRQSHDENVMVSIGPNNTRVPHKLYESINWDNPSIATRKLLMAIFDRNTLATHSMTGKPSPAFKGQAKPQKQRLDPRVTEDIVFVVTRRCRVSDKEVRNAITTKCADENKMMKLQLNKKNSSQRIHNNNNNSINNKENQHYIAQQ